MAEFSPAKLRALAGCVIWPDRAAVRDALLWAADEIQFQERCLGATGHVAACARIAMSYRGFAEGDLVKLMEEFVKDGGSPAPHVIQEVVDATRIAFRGNKVT